MPKQISQKVWCFLNPSKVLFEVPRYSLFFLEIFPCQWGKSSLCKTLKERVRKFLLSVETTNTTKRYTANTDKIMLIKCLYDVLAVVL